MRIERELGAAAGSPPFLSVVTRCYERPEALANNVASLESQDDPDYEHIFLIDEEGVGLEEANRALAQVTPAGTYVLILDDDDMLADDGAIAALKQAAATQSDVIVFRAEHAHLGILPDRTVWERRPVKCHIGSCDFITRRDWWEAHIHAFGAPECGDYRFLAAIWDDGPNVTWLDRVLAAVQRISEGEPE